MEIVLCGGDGVGKSTTAQTIALQHRLQIFSFGTALRELCIEKGFLAREEAYAPRKSDRARLILRVVGESVRHTDPSYWARQLEVVMPQDGWIIDDCRKTIDLWMALNKGAIGVFLDGEFEDDASHDELLRVREACQIVIPAKSAHARAIGSLIVQEVMGREKPVRDASNWLLR